MRGKSVEWLLAYHRANCAGHEGVLVRYLPFVQCKRTDLLRPSEGRVLYQAIRHRVLLTTNSSFRIDQYKNFRSYCGDNKLDEIHDMMDTRTLMFYEMCEHYPKWNGYDIEKTAGWLCSHHRFMFFRYEAILQCRKLGIALSGAPLEIESQNAFVKAWVEFFHYVRKYPDDANYEHLKLWYTLRHGREPSLYMQRKTIENFEWVRTVIIESGGLQFVKMHGFGDLVPTALDKERAFGQGNNRAGDLIY